MLKKCFLLLCFCFSSSIFAQNEIGIAGSAFVPIIAKRPDLFLGISYSRNILGKLQLSADIDYSFRHQINSINEKGDIPVLQVIQTDSTGRKIFGMSTVYITKYEESGYCFVIRVNPKYRIRNYLFGLGIGYEFGEYEQKYTTELAGKIPPILSQIAGSSASLKMHDNTIQYFLNAMYTLEKYSVGCEFNYKSNDVYGIGFWLSYAIFTF
jgi:hypothetical protein